MVWWSDLISLAGAMTIQPFSIDLAQRSTHERSEPRSLRCVDLSKAAHNAANPANHSFHPNSGRFNRSYDRSLLRSQAQAAHARVVDKLRQHRLGNLAI